MSQEGRHKKVVGSKERRKKTFGCCSNALFNSKKGYASFRVEILCFRERFEHNVGKTHTLIYTRFGVGRKPTTILMYCIFLDFPNAFFN